MKELFDQLTHKPLDRAKAHHLLDTCFIWYMLEHPKEMKKMEVLGTLALSSFTVGELIYTKKKVKSSDKHLLRDFLKRTDAIVIDIDVKPGQRNKEKQFVRSIDAEILKHCADPSDAVLVAVAVSTKSDIFTRDKHHIFTAELENYLAEKEVYVFNK